jgi:hypothetical protein
LIFVTSPSIQRLREIRAIPVSLLTASAASDDADNAEPTSTASAPASAAMPIASLEE